jgi:hypothetical protein
VVQAGAEVGDYLPLNVHPNIFRGGQVLDGCIYLIGMPHKDIVPTVFERQQFCLVLGGSCVRIRGLQPLREAEHRQEVRPYLPQSRRLLAAAVSIPEPWPRQSCVQNICRGMRESIIAGSLEVGQNVVWQLQA